MRYDMLVERVNQILASYTVPLTLRQVYYRLVASDRISRYCSAGKAAVVLHFADHDPSGIDMSRDLQDRLDKYCGGVQVKRVALIFDQVQSYNLIPNPAVINPGEEYWDRKVSWQRYSRPVCTRCG